LSRPHRPRLAGARRRPDRAQALAAPFPGKLYFDTIVFDREQLRHLVNLWGADHLVVGTDYPYDMGWYDPRGFVDGCDFLGEADRAKIEGLNAAKLLKLGRRLASMGAPAASAKTTAPRARARRSRS
jgi:hypothetical protein